MSDTAGRQFSCVLEAGSPPMKQLEGCTRLDAETLRDAMTKGAVWLQRSGRNGLLRKPVRIRSLDDEIAAGDVVLVNHNPAVLAEKVSQPDLVSDQVNYSIWNKPGGVFSQGSKWGDHCSITQLVEQLHGKPCYLVHRLDRAANGLMIVAHTRNALNRLASLFEQRAIAKFYRVTVQGKFDHSLPHEIRQPVGGKPAFTRVLKCSHHADSHTSELELQITTGRKHQIRIHLAAAGYPVLGDRLYAPNESHATDLQLAAVRLEFICPFTDRHLSIGT